MAIQHCEIISSSDISAAANFSVGFMILSLSGERIGNVFLGELSPDSCLEVFEDESRERGRIRVVFTQRDLPVRAGGADQCFKHVLFICIGGGFR